MGSDIHELRKKEKNVMGGTINVLHVDDEKDFLNLTKTFLKKIDGEQMRVCSLFNPFEVIEKVKEKTFDVIVTDYKMPGMDGLTLLSNLRTENFDTPVIIFTGRGREEVAIKALNLGADYYIEKGGDPKSQFSELSHVIRQVVNHKRIEKALSESEERYRIIFDESPISLWEEDFSKVKQYFDVLREQGITDFRQHLTLHPNEVDKLVKMVEIINVNNTTLKLYEAKDKKEFYEGLVTFFDEEAFLLFKEELIALFNGRTVYQSEFPGFKLTGEKINVIVRLSVIPGYENTLEKIIVSVIDITKLKRVEKILRISEERYRRLIELSPDAIILSDLGANILILNHQAVKLLGADSEDDLIGKNTFDFIVPEDHDRALKNLKEVLETGSVRDVEYSMMKKGGAIFPVEQSVAVIFDKNNQPISLIGVLRDITERKKGESKLIKQKEELSEFAHFMVHDINNCLITIEGYLQLLDLEYDKTHIITRQIHYLKGLLKRSLTLADAGLTIEKKDRMNLNGLVERIAEATIPKEITFTHDNLPTLLCDFEKILQVFRNLFENAVTHGNPKKIDVKVIKDSLHLKIQIINDGEIIPDKVQEKIFDYGFTTLRHSMGLGLSIVRKIIDAHGWQISVQSTEEKTTFQISIPNELLN